MSTMDKMDGQGSTSQATQTNKEKKDRKHRKRNAGSANEAGLKPNEVGLSLFKEVKDVELDDVFSKGVRPSDNHVGNTNQQAAFSVPVGTVPAASSSKQLESVPPASAEVTGTEVTTKKRRRARKPEERSASSALLKDHPNAVPEAGGHDDAASAVSEGDAQDGSDVDLTHETLHAGPSKSKRARHRGQKYIPPDESTQDRDRRTVFVGNLPIEVAKSKVSLGLSS
jgi:nucleolar protein 12